MFLYDTSYDEVPKSLNGERDSLILHKISKNKIIGMHPGKRLLRRTNRVDLANFLKKIV